MPLGAPIVDGHGRSYRAERSRALDLVFDRIANLPTCTSICSQLSSGSAIEHPLSMIMGQRITA
jgi:hypothetical protein